MAAPASFPRFVLGPTLCLLGLGLGCAGDPAASVEPQVEPAPEPEPEPSMRVAGHPPARFTDPQRREKLEGALPNITRALTELRQLEDVPALAAGVVIDGELVYARAYGYADRESQRRATIETRFRIGSLTKVFTALSLLRERDAGQLQLSDPVVEVLPELAGLVYPSADSRPITFADLLTHSSGLPRVGYLPYWDPEQAFDETELLASLEGFALERAPGSAYVYSNLGFGLLGVALGRVAGEPPRERVQHALLEPLGMHATTWDLDSIAPELRATAYELAPDGQLRPTPDWNMGAMAMAGGLYSTVEDLGRFGAWQLDAWPARDEEDDPILARASSREAQSTHYAHGSGRHGPKGVGYAWQQHHECFARVVSHSGGTEGFSTYLALMPDRGVGVIALANSSAIKTRKYGQRMLELLYESGGLVRRQAVPLPELEASASAFAALLSSYSHEAYADLAAPILNHTSERELREAELSWWSEQLGSCEIDEAQSIPAPYRGTYRLRCSGGEATLKLRVQPGPERVLTSYELRSAAVEPSAPTRALAEAAHALLGQWNEHGFELSFASKWSSEGIRGFLERIAEAEGSCSLGDPIKVYGPRKALFALDCERRPMTMKVLVSSGEQSRIIGLEIYARERGGC